MSVESNVECNENCPNLFVPNVFTPENRDGVNDYFPGVTKTDPDKCPRFVKMMNIKIYNRWGDRVYAENTQHPDQQPGWNGRDSNGQEAPAGVYYYIVEVDFDLMDQATRMKELRGWVSLIR